MLFGNDVVLPGKDRTCREIGLQTMGKQVKASSLVLIRPHSDQFIKIFALSSQKNSRKTEMKNARKKMTRKVNVPEH